MLCRGMAFDELPISPKSPFDWRTERRMPPVQPHQLLWVTAQP